MATKKLTTEPKVYVAFDEDGYPIFTDTLKEITSNMGDMDEDELKGWTIAEVGPKKKFTLTPATLKLD